jgi:hypothetical protein
MYGELQLHLKKNVSEINLTGSLGSFIPLLKTKTKIRLRTGMRGLVSNLSKL